MNKRTLLALGISVFFSALVVSAEQDGTAESSPQGVIVESVEDGDLVVEDESKDRVSGPEVEDSSTAVVPPKEEKAAGIEAASSSDKGLNLDELLSEEGQEDLLAGEGTVELQESGGQPTDSSSAPKASAEIAPVKQEPEAKSKPPQRVRKNPPPSSSKNMEVGKADTVSSEPVIEEVQSINFAHNLKEYRSPRLAMLMSFLVPGLGQAYSKSYLKAGAFVAAEAAIIGVAIAYNVKGANVRRDARDFADKHFSVDSLDRYKEALAEEFANRGRAGYGDTLFSERFQIDSFFYAAAEHKQNSFYEMIQGSYLTPGWIDCEPKLDEIVSHGMADTIDGSYGRYMRNDEDTVTSFYFVKRIVNEAGRRIMEEDLTGYSNYQSKYKSMISESNSHYDAAKYSLFGLILNHVVSAVDAGFTAKAYNSYLLGQETVWNRLNLEQQYVFTGSETVPGVALRVRF